MFAITWVASAKSCCGPIANSGNTPAACIAITAAAADLASVTRAAASSSGWIGAIPALLDRRLVHARGVVRADLVERRIARRPLGRGVEHLVEHVLGVLDHELDRAPRRAVGRDHRGLEEAAARERVEVGARVGLRVDPARDDAGLGRATSGTTTGCAAVPRRPGRHRSPRRRRAWGQRRAPAREWSGTAGRPSTRRRRRRGRRGAWSDDSSKRGWIARVRRRATAARRTRVGRAARGQGTRLRT